MKLRKELWFGFSLMAAIIIPVIVLMPWGHLTNGHLGLMMLALICVGIMLGFPTAFTLMGMGVFFAWLAYRSVDPATAGRQVLDLFVQRDRKSTRLNSSHRCISYAVFCLKKK